MIQNVLSHIRGIELYGILSMGLFFLTFLGVLLWVVGLRKPYLERMGGLPLTEDSPRRHEGREGGACHESAHEEHPLTPSAAGDRGARPCGTGEGERFKVPMRIDPLDVNVSHE